MITVETMRQGCQCGKNNCACHRPGGHVHCPCHNDEHPSLWISEKNDKIILKCFAGCPQDQIISALKERSLWPRRRQPPWEPAEVYDYHDLAGVLIFQVCRYQTALGKTFKQRRPDGKGGYIWKMAPVRPIPYRLPQLARANEVFIVEGEKDVASLEKFGLTATCNPGGAGKWRREFNKYFKGKVIVILPDNDVPGRNHSQNVARQLQGIAASVKVVELPGLAEKGDVTNWIAGGGNLGDLRALVKATSEWRPPDPSQAPAEGFALSDLGNAWRMATLFGQELRYCALSKKWHFWSGKNWAIDNTGEVERRAIRVIEDLKPQAGKKSHEEMMLQERFARKCENARAIESMIKICRFLPGMYIDPKEFDADPWLLNCLNGTIDLRSGELRPHDPADLLTCMVPVAYEREASYGAFERFLYQIMLVEEQPKIANEMVSFLQRALGYALTGSCREQCFFLLWGSGSNGKTTLVNLLTRLLGSYARNTPVDTLMARDRRNEIRSDIARLDGPRFVTAKEVDRGGRLSESLVKELTGQDTITARFLYGEYFDFIPQFKLFLATNNKPVIRGSDKAIWRRIMFIRFPLELAKEDQDAELPHKLWAEASGILAWLVRGCLQWQEMGLDPPEEVLKATAEYRAEMDALQDFLKDKCLVDPELSECAANLYKAYGTWADEQGLTEKERLKQRSFGICLSEQGLMKTRTTGGLRIWRGLGLRSSVSMRHQVTHW
jgi:putative DNA primase/helicase